MLHTKYQGSMLCGFRRIFHVFPIYAYVKHVTPRAGPFWPQGHNLNKLSIGLLDEATYQNIKAFNRPFGFRQEVFFKFLCRKSFITCVI